MAFTKHSTRLRSVACPHGLTRKQKIFVQPKLNRALYARNSACRV